MSPFISSLLLGAFGLYALVIVVEFAMARAVRRMLIQAVGLFAVYGFLHFTTDFPNPREAFGGATPILAILLMFVCVLLGMAARYFFYLRGKFSPGSLLKPLCISPIVLLPLLGSVQGTTSIDSIQLVSFGFLAFQNGFFWQAVFENARAQT